MGVTFVLVHGTFAHSAEWPALEGALSSTAIDLGIPARFEKLVWTGKNVASARQVAAETILDLLQKIDATSSDEKIFLIGHSHGGSAIAYFLKQHPELSKRLCGCAFLSTPFVAIRQRTQVGRLVWALLYLPILVSFITWTAFETPESFSREWGTRLVQMPLLYWIVIGLFGLGSILLLKYFNAERVHGLVEKTIEQQTADLPVGEYCFLRCSGDEAAAALSAVQFIAWCGIKLSRLLAWLAPKGPTDAFRFFVAAFVFPVWAHTAGPELAAMSSLGIAQSIENEGYFAIGMLFVEIMVVVFFALCFICAILIIVTQSVMSWAFGWTRLLTGFLVEFAIEPLPFGTCSLVHIDWKVSSAKLDSIVHSWTYAHPTAIKHLQSWIFNLLREHRGTKSS
jgi:hypothetical protein